MLQNLKGAMSQHGHITSKNSLEVTGLWFRICRSGQKEALKLIGCQSFFSFFMSFWKDFLPPTAGITLIPTHLSNIDHTSYTLGGSFRQFSKNSASSGNVNIKLKTCRETEVEPKAIDSSCSWGVSGHAIYLHRKPIYEVSLIRVPWPCELYWQDQHWNIYEETNKSISDKTWTKHAKVNWKIHKESHNTQTVNTFQEWQWDNPVLEQLSIDPF